MEGGGTHVIVLPRRETVKQKVSACGMPNLRKKIAEENKQTHQTSMILCMNVTVLTLDRKNCMRTNPRNQY